MQPDRILRLARSWSRLEPQADAAMGRFYDRLFETSASARRHFAGVDLAAQRGKLAAAISTVLSSLEDFDALRPALSDLGRRHARLGVTPQDYADVGAALLWTLEQALGPGWTADLAADWAAAYGLVSGVMQSPGDPGRPAPTASGMRVVVVGAGSVGGYFGARLARSGTDVTFLARGDHLAAMQAHGLQVRSAVDGDWQVRVRALADLAGEPPADVVLLCVKSYDTDAALDGAAPVVGPRTAVLSLQNGVDNEDRIARRFGAGHAMGGVAYVFADLAAPGTVAHHQLGRIELGELAAGGPSDRAAAVAACCRDAGIAAEVVPDIRRALWRKYVFLTALAGTSAVTRLPAGLLRRVPETRDLWRRQVEELLALAEAEAAGLEPGTADAAERLLDGLAPGNYPSLCQDLRSGRRLELDALHGHAVRLGRRHDIPTPALAAVDAALRPHLGGPPTLTQH